LEELAHVLETVVRHGHTEPAEGREPRLDLCNRLVDRRPPVVAKANLEVGRSFPVSLSPLLETLGYYVVRCRFKLGRFGCESRRFEALGEAGIIECCEV
jgi:hypothetical protein